MLNTVYKAYSVVFNLDSVLLISYSKDADNVNYELPGGIVTDGYTARSFSCSWLRKHFGFHDIGNGKLINIYDLPINGVREVVVAYLFRTKQSQLFEDYFNAEYVKIDALSKNNLSKSHSRIINEAWNMEKG